MADGDEATFTRIYREHADSIYAYLRYHLADPAMAEDVTAQVFLEAWRQRETVVIDPELGWAPWLFGVARNLVRVASRTNARHARVDTTADSPAWGVVPDPAVSHAERDERHRVLEAAPIGPPGARGPGPGGGGAGRSSPGRRRPVAGRRPAATYARRK
ncbi:MAG: hypothetical protein MUF33_08275 [Candidatus Nanopelagicales bacterium]|nr:hypothetical protein [Candidatus Nanopelagicales bacterium]